MKQTDTSPEIEAIQLAHLRQMSPARKLTLVGEMNCTVRALALAGLKQRYPHDTPTQRRRRLASLILGEPLATQVYGAADAD